MSHCQMVHEWNFYVQKCIYKMDSWLVTKTTDIDNGNNNKKQIIQINTSNGVDL